MKACVGVLTQEGFLTGIFLSIDNGLILRTFLEGGANLAWCGEQKKQEVISQFDDLVDNLVKDGWTIDGLEVLDEYREREYDEQHTESEV